jgi:hypothetical protein
MMHGTYNVKQTYVLLAVTCYTNKHTGLHKACSSTGYTDIFIVPKRQRALLAFIVSVGAH